VQEEVDAVEEGKEVGVGKKGKINAAAMNRKIKIFFLPFFSSNLRHMLIMPISTQPPWSLVFLILTSLKAPFALPIRIG
jgi:hypothetical protein